MYLRGGGGWRRVGAPNLSIRRFGHCPSSGVSPNIVYRTGSVPSPGVKGTEGTTGVIVKEAGLDRWTATKLLTKS
jgi:hypothetical protein